MAIIMDGKVHAKAIRERLAEEILESKDTKSPRLAIIANAEDSASITYVKNKKKDCTEVGIACEIFYPSANELVESIIFANLYYDAVICQLPMVDGVDVQKTLKRINKHKDVDGLNSDEFDACTPMGIMELLALYDIDVSGKHCVIVGRSDIVGKPLAKMMLNADATVTVCHSKTKNLSEITKMADILVVAVGKEKFVNGDMVKDGVVVVDVGINRDENGKLCGDVDFDNVVDKASYITPVPGGIGPMTRAMLLKNVVKAWKNHLTNEI